VVALTVQELGVRVAGRNILENVSFSVPAKSVVALYGPSGSGKSTTLLAICGLLDDSFEVTGRVLLGIQEISRLPPERRSRLGLSILLQGLGLFPNLTALQNVAYPLQRRGVERGGAHGLAAAALDRFRLADLANRLPSQLSGGQQQRVALARAIVFSPSVLLLDEPFKGLDQQLKDELLAAVTGLASSGISIVLVSHERREIDLTADVVASIREGRVVDVEQRAGVGSVHPPFYATADRVFLPEHGAFAGGWVPATSVSVSLAGHSGDAKTSAASASVLLIRTLGGDHRVLLCRYESGALAWLEVSDSALANVNSGDVVRVEYRVERRS
jgi:ABC-type sulfate/molybdate transport systems ATPase subunit